MVVEVWKYDALTVVVFLLNVKLVLHPKNVSIALGKNVAVGTQCNARSSSSLYDDNMVMMNDNLGMDINTPLNTHTYNYRYSYIHTTNTYTSTGNKTLTIILYL
jgi:hypothetical protein